MNSHYSILIRMMKSIYLSIGRRKKIISFFIVDLITLKFIFLKVIDSSFLSRDLSNLFIFFWVLFSYFLGRYYAKITNFRFIIFETIIKSFLIVCLTLSVSIFFNYFLKPYSYLFEFKIIDFLALILYSFLSNLMILLLNTRKSTKLGNWLVLNDKNKFFNNINVFLDNNQSVNFIHVADFENIVKLKYLADGLIIFNKQGLETEALGNLLKLQKEGLNIIDPLQWCQENLLRYPTELIVNSSSYFSFNKHKNLIYSRIKRILDILFSSFLLLITSPIILISCLLIFLEEKGPIFYSQIRTGYRGKPFKIWKIRSMRVNSEPNGAVWSSRNDKRVLRFGKILRNSRIDELPQLISVILGDMSLIGPRPERPEIEVELIEKLPNYLYRYQVKPGLSGWAQINYPYGASYQDSKNKLSYDFFYIFDYSLNLDLIIFFKTIRIILGGSGSKPVR